MKFLPLNPTAAEDVAGGIDITEGPSLAAVGIEDVRLALVVGAEDGHLRRTQKSRTS